MEFGIRRQLYFCAFGFAVGVLLLLAGAWTDINVLIVRACLMVFSCFIGGWLLYNNEVPTRLAREQASPQHANGERPSQELSEMYAQIHDDMSLLFTGQDYEVYRNVSNGILYNINGNLFKVFLVSDHVSVNSIFNENEIALQLALGRIGVQPLKRQEQQVEGRVYHIIPLGKIGQTLDQIAQRTLLWDNDLQQFVTTELDKIWDTLPRINNMTSITIHLEDLMLHTTDDGKQRLLLFDYSTAVYGEGKLDIREVRDDLYTNIVQTLPDDSEVRTELISYLERRRLRPN